MILQDSEGNKFSVDPADARPVREKLYLVNKSRVTYPDKDNEHTIINVITPLSDPTAEKIQAALEEVMEYIFDPSPRVNSIYYIEEKANQAYEAVQNELKDKS